MLAALVRDPLPGWAAVVVGWQQLRQRGGQQGNMAGQRAPLMVALIGVYACCIVYDDTLYTV